MRNILLGTLVICFSTIYAQSNNQAPWQQKVDYNIKVSLDDENHVLNGDLVLNYTNNSPDELTYIWFHIWPNAYKNNNTAFAKQQLKQNNTSFYFAKDRERGYIDSLNFEIDGTSCLIKNHPEHIDIIQVFLPKPLKSGASINISTPFRVKIPGSFSRLGHVKNSYQISQWYPKPAVYDVNGWNKMPYLDQGEFYSEFGSFEVSITLPKNYVLAATGELQDTSEINWLDYRIRYYEQNEDRKEEEIASSALLKTVTFKQDKIHDFAWFADKNFYVFKSSVLLKDSSKRVNTFLYSNNKFDKNAIQYVNDGIFFYSDKVGNYPYSVASAVIGPLKAGGGMEYPMITILASSDKTTIVHEIGHNWFYGIIGSNERNHPWMDESINTYYEQRQDKQNKLNLNYLSKKGTTSKVMDGLYLSYSNSITRNTQQAVNLHSEQFTSANYGGIIYGKGAYIFDVLQNHLGDSLFDAAIKNYYETWKFKHPLPFDFKNSITTFTGKNLDWFFEDLLSTEATYDYKIKRIRFKKLSETALGNGTPNYQVLVKNNGKANAPFQIAALNSAGKIVNDKWINGFSGKQWIAIPGTERLSSLEDTSLKIKEASRVIKRMEKIEVVALNLENSLAENNIHNNRIKTKGIFKTTEKLAIGANHLDRRTTFSVLPIVNYNYYDNWMYGLVANNLAHWERRFNYYGTFMYSNSLAPIKYEVGARQIFALPLKNIKRLDINVKLASFGHEYSWKQERSTYRRSNIEGKIYLAKPENISLQNTSEMKLGYNRLRDVIDRNDNNTFHTNTVAYSDILYLNYTFETGSKLNPMGYSLNFEQIRNPENFTFGVANTQKVFGHIKKTLSFSKQKSQLSMRYFIGFVFGNNIPSAYNYSSAGTPGSQDYHYQHNLFARSETLQRDSFGNNTLGSRVLVPNFSEMRVPVAILSNAEIQAINLDYQIKKKSPFGLFFDATYSSQNIGAPALNYVGGVSFRLIKDYLEIYLPIIYSKGIAENLEQNNIRPSRFRAGSYSSFTQWHRLINFKLNIDFSQDKLIEISGL